MDMEPKDFQTSTPKKREIECEDCSEKSESVECIVKRFNGEHVGVSTALWCAHLHLVVLSLGLPTVQLLDVLVVPIQASHSYL